MEYKEENIGRIFKDAFDDYAPSPDEKVWENVLHESKSKPFYSTKTFISIASIAAVALIVSIALIFNDDSKEQLTSKTNVENKENIIVQPMPIENNSKEIIIDDEESVSEIEETQIIINPISEEETIENNNEKIDEIIDNNKIETEQPIVIPEEIKTTENSVKKEDIVVDNENKTANKQIEPIQENVVDSKSNFDSTGLVFGDNPVICFGEDAELFVSEGFSYKWNTGAYTNKIFVSPVDNSKYTVTITDRNGNSIEYEFEVTVDKSCTAVLIPSAFSPDNDGINDKLEIYAKGIQKFNIRILSRSGQLVFTTNNIDEFWDGTLNGSYLETGVYVYQVVYIDAKGNQQNKQGTVSIIR